MEVLINPSTLPGYIDKTAITIGNFDGIHIGHQALINKVLQLAGEGCTSGLVSFNPHPVKLLNGAKAPLVLTPLRKKMRILQSLGVRLMVLFDFNHTFSQLAPGAFVRDYLIHTIRARHIVVGRNFRFGFEGRGTPEELKALARPHGCRVHVMPDITFEEQTVSSSLVRALIKKGRVERANRLLGRCYTILGKVQKGFGLARFLGFPTANLPLPEEMVPARGVYLAWCTISPDHFPCIINVGITPTVRSRPLFIEVHILNQEIELYNEEVEIHFIKRLREEKKFATIDMLKQAIAGDVEKAERFFSGLTGDTNGCFADFHSM